MRCTVLALLLLAACGDDGPTTPPDAAGVQVAGCADPRVWTEPALEEGYATAYVGGGPCSMAQYPLHRVGLGWSGPGGYWDQSQRQHLGNVCWRVTDASPGSGWSSGQTFVTDAKNDNISMMVTGFARPVTIEGRVLREDGTIVVALPAMKIELASANMVEPDASAAIAVMTPEAWAERNAVHVRGQRIATDEVLDATAIPSDYSTPITLEKSANGFVRRVWRHVDEQIVHDDLSLGAGTQGRIAGYGNAIVVDNELLIVGYVDQEATVRFRVPLAAPPKEIVGDGYFAWLHVDGALVRFNVFDATPATLTVGAGILLPSHLEPPFFFDGTTFHAISLATDLPTFDDQRSFTPSAADLAALGKPVAVYEGIVLGENGFLAAFDPASDVVGPRFLAFADLFGGGHLAGLSADVGVYRVANDDGTAAIYEAPATDYCE